MREASWTNGRVFHHEYDGDEWLHCTHCGTPNVRREVRHGPIEGSTGRRPLMILYVCPNRPLVFGSFTQHTEQLVYPRTPRPMPRVIADTPEAS